MKALRELAVSGQHLQVFEVAARRQSFTEAARELGVTRPTVRRFVRQLEESLATGLFVRHGRAVQLTEAGRTLHAAVGEGFSLMHEAAVRLHPSIRPRVRVLCTAAHAHCWLAPGLADFRRLHPAIDLRVEVVTQYVDLDGSEPAGMVLGLWSGEEPRPGYECLEFAVEEVFPVASPVLAQSLACDNDLVALAGERLIHEDESQIPTVAWKEFLESFGVAYRDPLPGLQLANYELVLQAAIAGQGIALGWSHFVDPLLKSGLLVPVGTRRLRTGRRFYLVWPAGTQLAPEAEIVKEWVAAQSTGAS